MKEGENILRMFLPFCLSQRPLAQCFPSIYKHKRWNSLEWTNDNVYLQVQVWYWKVATACIIRKIADVFLKYIKTPQIQVKDRKKYPAWLS